MSRPTSAALLEAKLEEAKRLEAEIRLLKNAARDKKRAEEEQRGKVVGRLVLAEMAAHPDSELARTVNRLLAEKLTRPSERGLFQELNGAEATEPAGTV